MSRRTASLAAAAAFISVDASAFPDGAPWGAANPDGVEACSACHNDYAPVRDSDDLRIVGLPLQFDPGKRYRLVISFDDADSVVSGFQLLLITAGNTGTVEGVGDDLEIRGGAVRSTRPRPNDDGVTWTLRWTAPEQDAAPIRVLLAASASNDDQSALGDRIHYREYRVEGQDD